MIVQKGNTAFWRQVPIEGKVATLPPLKTCFTPLDLISDEHGNIFADSVSLTITLDYKGGSRGLYPKHSPTLLAQAISTANVTIYTTYYGEAQLRRWVKIPDAVAVLEEITALPKRRFSQNNDRVKIVIERASRLLDWWHAEGQQQFNIIASNSKPERTEINMFDKTVLTSGDRAEIEKYYKKFLNLDRKHLAAIAAAAVVAKDSVRNFDLLIDILASNAGNPDE